MALRWFGWRCERRRTDDYPLENRTLRRLRCESDCERIHAVAPAADVTVARGYGNKASLTELQACSFALFVQVNRHQRPVMRWVHIHRSLSPLVRERQMAMGRTAV